MKTFYKLTFSLACMLITIIAVTSCGLGDRTDPEHPLYVTYTISASNLSFTGPDSLLVDIEDWIENNHITYDVQVTYSTGEASEFTTTDASAVTKYEAFLPKFKTYLNEMKSKVASGKYGANPVVNATFSVYAKRAQGQSGDLKYDQVSFTYPENGE